MSCVFKVADFVKRLRGKTHVVAAATAVMSGSLQRYLLRLAAECDALLTVSAKPEKLQNKKTWQCPKSALATDF